LKCSRHDRCPLIWPFAGAIFGHRHTPLFQTKAPFFAVAGNRKPR
jgi:hypothetical protein